MLVTELFVLVHIVLPPGFALFVPALPVPISTAVSAAISAAMPVPTMLLAPVFLMPATTPLLFAFPSLPASIFTSSTVTFILLSFYLVCWLLLPLAAPVSGLSRISSCFRSRQP